MEPVLPTMPPREIELPPLPQATAIHFYALPEAADLPELPPADACKCCAGEGIVECAFCNGGLQSTSNEDCPQCHGRGHVWCEACGGKGVRDGQEKI